MLTKGTSANDLDSGYSSIHNYYENLVIEMLTEDPRASALSRDLQADAACLALNSLPSKYIRHDVDMAFYLSTEDQQKLMAQVAKAVAQALEQIAPPSTKTAQDQPQAKPPQTI